MLLAIYFADLYNTVDMEKQLTHLDESGRLKWWTSVIKQTPSVWPLPVGVHMQPETLQLIMEGQLKKGDVLTIAQLAGVMAAKHTSELIPLCHPLLLSHIDVTCTPNPAASRVDIEATVRVSGKTGVEMEALTAVSIAGLTIYDMAKAVDRGMRLTNVHLVHKSGGRSGEWPLGEGDVPAEDTGQEHNQCR